MVLEKNRVLVVLGVLWFGLVLCEITRPGARTISLLLTEVGWAFLSPAFVCLFCCRKSSSSAVSVQESGKTQWEFIVLFFQSNFLNKNSFFFWFGFYNIF